MTVKNLRVKNWEQFQHYKDRNPPWIKLHFALLASEDWVTLDDASKLLAVVCMLIASRNNGEVPNNPAYLKRVAYLDKLPKLEPLISCGFLEIPQASASTLQAPASAVQADARPETETETDKKDSLSETSSDDPPEKKAERYPPDFEAFWLAYPRSPNMSKSKALAGWKKLSSDERAACAKAVPAYKAFLASKPDHPTMHATTFINERRFEGFAPAAEQPSAPIDDDRWLKRLVYARQKGEWPTAWGPRPGEADCAAPTHLLEAGDGANWAEMEITR